MKFPLIYCIYLRIMRWIPLIEQSPPEFDFPFHQSLIIRTKVITPPMVASIIITQNMIAIRIIITNFVLQCSKKIIKWQMALKFS